MFYTDPSGNVCPEGTKDPLLRAPVPSPNQQQSTALVPYDPDFAAKQNALYGNGYANANKSVPNSGRQLANFIVGPEGTIVSRDLYTKSNADFIQEVANISVVSIVFRKLVCRVWHE